MSKVLIVTGSRTLVDLDLIHGWLETLRTVLADADSAPIDFAEL